MQINSTVIFYTIDEENLHQRLDNYLISKFKSVPKSHIYRIIRKGEVRVNKKRAKACFKLNIGDIVRIPPIKFTEKPKPSLVTHSKNINKIESAIIHEDNSLIVIDKPAGMAVHGGTGISIGIIEALRLLRPKCKTLELIHRLDSETSGCLLIAKKRSMLRYMHQEFRERRVDKNYQLLVFGLWPKTKTVVNFPLKRQVLTSGERIVKIDEEGKSARTWFRIVRHYENHTLLNVKLDTGRTHQIRVHAQGTGYPIVGDNKYCDNKQEKKAKEIGVKSLMLHASKIKFTSMDGNEMKFSSNLPEHFEFILNNIEKLKIK